MISGPGSIHETRAQAAFIVARVSGDTDASPQPAPLRERQKQFTRQQLIEAAREEFGSRGFADTTVEDIVARAGASRATFYMHFASKAHVLAEVSEAVHPEVAELYRRLDAALATGSRASLRDWLEEIFAWWERQGPLLPAWEQAQALEPEFSARVNEINRRLPDVMTAYLSRCPAEKREQARLRIVLLEAQLSRFLFRSPVSSWSDDEREMILDVVTNMWHVALRSDDR